MVRLAIFEALIAPGPVLLNSPKYVVKVVHAVERMAVGAIKLPMLVPRYTAAVELPFGCARYTYDALDPGFC